jgi:hypothetical protein
MKLQKIDRREALMLLNVRGETPPDITALLDKYEPLLLGVISPRWVYETYQIGADLMLRGSDIKSHLKDCNKIIIFAATLGLQADELIRQTEAADMAGAVVLDALASAAIEQLCDAAEAEIKQKYKKITTRFSPGYGDFPLSVQGELLKFLNAEKKIGLYVNSANLLIPKKSVTAVIGCRERF